MYVNLVPLIEILGTFVMNIFYLHEDPAICSSYHCDKHVVKMILEYSQLLSTAHRVLDGYEGEECYKKTHQNHPCAIWVRQSKENYEWLYKLLVHCHDEYTFRYNRIHKSSRILRFISNTPKNIKSNRFQTPPQCMPEEYQRPNVVDAYKAYYIGDKAYFAVWKAGQPAWFV